MASPTLSTEQAQTTLTMPDAELFLEIDGLQLNERLLRWKEARRIAPSRVCTRRQQLAMESWKETEGEDIEIRRAKMLAKILASVPIDILDFDLIVGRISTGLLAATTAIDICGDYIPDLWEDDANLELTLTAKGALSAEDRQILRECTKYFAGKTAPDHIQSAWHNLVGTWSDDCVEAKLKDPAPAVGFVPGASGSLMWDRALAKGMRGFIDEAQGHIDSFLKSRDTDIRKLYFWKSVMIVCEAAIAYTHRYAELARQMAKPEPNAARKQELLQIAEICDWVPENQPRSFHEAIQAMHLIGVCKNLEDPACYYPVLGRIDQYLWPYFESDYRKGGSDSGAGRGAAGVRPRALGQPDLHCECRFPGDPPSQLRHQLAERGRSGQGRQRRCESPELSYPPRDWLDEAFHSHCRFAVAQGHAALASG